VVLCLAAVTAAHAVPVPCPNATTLADLVLLNAGGGCFLQDKLFTGFSYSGADAALVVATVVFEVGSGPAVHGWTFARQGGWTSGFTLAYTISVDPGAQGVTITGSKDQINTGLIPGGTSVTDTQTAVVLSLDGSSLASETAQATYTGVTSVTTSAVVTIPSGSLLVKLSQQFFQTTTE
jgi:hypothetical protein